MASNRIQLVDKDLPIHRFPSEPTCLAYDNEAKKLAIGCDNGEIIILDGQQCHMPQLPQANNGVKATDLLLSFGIGKDILLAAHKNKNHLLLWSAPYKNNPTQQELPENEIPTVLAWSSAYSTFFVGTTAGTVYQMFVSDSKMKKEDRTASMLRDKCNSAGEVVAIVEEPQTVEDKDTHNVLVLVVFSSGLCVLWNQQQGCSLQEQINDAGTSVCVPLYAWWFSSVCVFIACADGSIRGFQYSGIKKGWRCRQSFPCNGNNFVLKAGIETIAPGYFLQTLDVPEDLKSGKSITKLQFIPTLSTSLVYVGGCSSLPTESDDSNMLSKFSIFTKEYLPLVPFGGRIADILYLQPSAEQDPSVLAVLTESELVLLNMSTKSQEIKHSCGTIMLQYPRLSQFNGYPHFTPPITCLQYCGVCSQELLTTALQPQSRRVSDLIVTGHKDGSVRLWLMFYNNKSSSSVASFELTLVVYTAEYYEIPQIQQINLAGLKELSLVKVTSNQQCLLVVNKSCHVLLFKLYPHTITSAQTAANTKPQTHEVILMEVQYAMPPKEALQTPSPHLRSCQWQTHVQLLQHFICYCQSGRGKKLNPVPVNCVEYDKELAMLAVGTNKGLIILDMLTNMLIQVIGSEKKLLELSGCDYHGGSSVLRASRSECKVVKLCAAKICSTASQQYVPQLALWAGTVGGSLGVFTVTRNKNGEPFQLQRTGESRQKDSAVTSIQLIQTPVIPGTKCIEQWYSKTLESVEERSVTPTTYTVVTTEKQCYIHYAKKTEIADTTMTTIANILTSGIVTIMGKPYLICVLKNGTVNIYSLPDMNEMNVEDTKLDTKSTLYSSAGSFAVLQLSQSEKLKLITLQLFEFVTSSV